MVQFNSNYIIFRNVEIFRNIFFWRKIKESDGIYRKISVVEMESSKLINYLTKMFWTGTNTVIFAHVWCFLSSSFSKVVLVLSCSNCFQVCHWNANHSLIYLLGYWMFKVSQWWMQKSLKFTPYTMYNYEMGSFFY
jgi:hypothetical protein